MPPSPEELELPPCGIYRTVAPLTGRELSVPAGKLVYFHNHSQEGWPIVLLPHENRNNRWSFYERGYLVQDGGWVETLEALKPEGVYRLREHVHLGSEQVVSENALIQLGYDREARPIMFFPRPHESENALVFPVRGTRLTPAIYDLLEPLDVRGPHVPGVRHLH